MTDNTETKQEIRKRAFTLVELLVVISIIGVMAGLVVGLAGGATKQSRIKRVKSDLQNIMTAIDRFKTKYGTYPPDCNRALVIGGQTNYISGTNQLFYELVGSVHRLNASGKSEFYVPQLGLTLSQDQIRTWFGVDGFVNATEDVKDVENFLPNFKTNDVARIPQTGSATLMGLLVPVQNPGTNQNFWCYRSTNPTNNPTSYDLWAVVVIGKNTNIISNW
jgi:prepilin-type N-terminal cleavage/methylation domain-containing protein